MLLICVIMVLIQSFTMAADIAPPFRPTTLTNNLFSLLVISKLAFINYETIERAINYITKKLWEGISFT